MTNTSLRTIPPFDALIGVEGGIVIVDNAALTPVSGFAALQTIGGGIDINRNTLLASVSGFDLLATVGGDVNIGVPEIEGVGGSMMPAAGNPRLYGLTYFPDVDHHRWKPHLWWQTER